MTEAYDVTIGACDPMNPMFGYEIEVRANGLLVIKTGTHPVTGKTLDYAGCVEVAAMYGPARSSSSGGPA